MSQRFDLYVARSSWLHRQDARATLLIVVLAGATGIIFNQVAVLFALLVLGHVLLVSARIPLRHLGWFWVRLVPLLGMILLLQPLFAPGSGPDLLRMGSLRLTVGGLLYGISFALRTAALAFWTAVLVLTTEPTRLVQGMVKLGLPYTWGLTVGLAMRYVPTLYSLFVSVSEAQQARGWLVNQGGLLRRARAYVPILVATIIAALRLSDSLGLALAARGLGYPVRRTALYDLRFGAADLMAVVMATLAFAVLVALRYGLGFGARPW